MGVVIELPHYSVTEYLRDFFFGTLEKICAGRCPVCGGRVCHLELRLRSLLGLPIYRARCCGGCKNSLTFLPQFVCPGKWYGYSTIEKALLVVSRAASPHTAFQAWEEAREAKQDAVRTLPDAAKTPLPPSTSTLQRWWKELGQNCPEQPWHERALTESIRLSSLKWPGVNPSYGPDGLVGEETVSAISAMSASLDTPSRHPISPSSLFLKLLLYLGESLVGMFPSAPTSLLGIGLWFLETPFHQRCLARESLAGRIIPWSCPNLKVTPKASLTYLPEPSPPP
ncbi:MAG: hypothetical protein ACD_75C01107G0003 [uncultured bacterium]|nr:MAG: hypothetical protein ACD_75C01107G0003 [uncultured bacterium]